MKVKVFPVTSWHNIQYKCTHHVAYCFNAYASCYDIIPSTFCYWVGSTLQSFIRIANNTFLTSWVNVCIVSKTYTSFKSFQIDTEGFHSQYIISTSNVIIHFFNYSQPLLQHPHNYEKEIIEKQYIAKVPFQIVLKCGHTLTASQLILSA